MPTRAGLSDYLYSQPVTSGSQGQVLGVVDATGTQVCPNAFTYWSFGTCALTGTAPCFVIPPAGRAAAELVEDADSTDGAQAALTINDPSGTVLCTGSGYPTDWTICDYKAGVTYTAILVETRPTSPISTTARTAPSRWSPTLRGTTPAN